MTDFTPFRIQTSDPEVSIVGRRGGEGPPLLLLHGNPLTNLSWQRIAPRLARGFTVVATDLRGYGDSSKPRGKPDEAHGQLLRERSDFPMPALQPDQLGLQLEQPGPAVGALER